MSKVRLDEVAAALVELPGVVGVTLGGSRARGTHRPDSDVDLGVYVQTPLDVGPLAALAEQLTGGPVEIAPPGSWGRWVEGGAWLHLDGSPVDWILRDVVRVEEQVERAMRGAYAFHAQPGHPLGFLDVGYAGELATAVLLQDPTTRLTGLRSRITPYPAALSEAMVRGVWEAEFLVAAAAKVVQRGDTAYVVQCLSRAVLLAAHGLCAAAGVWVTNEKGLVALADATSGAPEHFAERAHRALGGVGSTPDQLNEAITTIATLVTETQRRLPALG